MATTIHKLQYPPSAILFRPLNGCAVQLQGLPHGTVPIFPQTKSFTIGPLSVKCTQFPITPAYAFTDYKAQGQTMDHVLIDLAKPPTGALSPFSAYVALSRGRGRGGIRLLRGFDHRLFTTHPSENLRREDDRLDTLERTTMERYLARELTL